MKKLYFIIIALTYASFTLAKPVVNHEYKYYPITGSTSAELRQQMSNNGPIIDGSHFDAKVNWHINWYYHWTDYHSNCSITSLDITVLINHVMPEWLNEQSTSSEKQLQWKTYLNNLKIHEQGHADNALRAAQVIESAVLQAPAMPNCKTLKNTLDNISYQIIKKHNEWDITYDKQTHHGRTQGAVYP
jgi:predicted secreted Zn-dependent protease